MTQPSLFGKHKYDTEEQHQSETVVLFIVLMIAGLFAFLYLLSWNAINMKETCNSAGGEMLIVKDGGRYDAMHCVKEGKIVRLF